jgi:hypothetical protein
MDEAHALLQWASSLAIVTDTETVIGRIVDGDAWEEGPEWARLLIQTRDSVPVTDYPNVSRLERGDQVVTAVPGQWPAWVRGCRRRSFRSAIKD